MIIQIRKERNSIKLNHDFASAVPEFSDVLEDERLGVPYMAYVAYVVDVAEDNIWAGLPDDIRRKEVAESLKLDKALLKDKKIADAISKYQLFCSQNIGYQFKEAHDNGMKKIAEYVKSKSTLSSDDAKEFASVLKEMPVILKGKGEIEKIQTKETAKGRVTAGRKLTLNEQG